LKSGAPLELLDQVLAEIAPTADDDAADDDPLSFYLNEKDQDAADRALAAVFNEQENWRLAI